MSPPALGRLTLPDPLGAIDRRLRLPGRRHRRMWHDGGRAHIEVRTLTRPGSTQLGERLVGELRRVDGVRWAEINAALGRLVLDFDEGAVGLDDILDVVEAVEHRHGASDATFSFDRLEHPGDLEPMRRALTAFTADIAGLGLSIAGMIARATPIPVELAGIVPLVDNEPRLRRILENRVGPATTDLALALANVAAQSLSQGPIGLAVDSLQQLNLYTEARERRRLWQRLEPRLCDEQTVKAEPIPHLPRPKPLPSGPVESYADRAGLASITAGVAAAATTASPRRGAAVMLAGLAKPARLGREAFAAQLHRTMSARDQLVMDHRVLRRLDRVDTVLVTANVAWDNGVEIERIEPADGADPIEIHRHLGRLFDGTDLTGTRTDGRWALRATGPGRRQLLRGEQIVARVSVRRRLNPGATALVASARHAGYMVVVDDQALAGRLGADLFVEGGAHLGASIRDLQADDCVVMLVSGPHDEALRRADCGVGVSEAGRPAWGADLMIDSLADAEFIVAAAGVAHEVSRQSAAVALAGTSIGSITALAAPVVHASTRAQAVVNAATVASMANGIRAAVTLAHRPRRAPVPPPWHELEVDDVLERLRRGEGGNGQDLSTAADTGPVLLGRSVLTEIRNPLTPVLLGGAAVSAAVGGGVDAAIVAGVTAANTLLGAAQRFRTELAVRELFTRSSIPVRLVRGARTVTRPAEALRPGDRIRLGAGDVVPADCRVLDAENLEVDESSLTGESAPVPKQSAPVVAPLVAERSSMLYEGTTVAAGTGEGVVVATGAATEGSAGLQLAAGAGRGGGVEAHLNRLTRSTLPIAVLGGAGVVLSGLAHGRPVTRTVSTAANLAVAAVPEGLPVVATLAQLAAGRRLSARGALTRNPRALEALGRAEVLCTDKTGTLTEGNMALSAVSDGRRVVGAAELGPAPDDGGEATSRRREDDNAALKQAIAVALRATPEFREPEDLPHLTDRAIATGAQRAGVTVATAAGTTRDGSWTRVTELPFEPSRGYHATLGTIAGGTVLSVKGAPEVVIPRCRQWHRDGRAVRMTARGREEVRASVERMARRGLRVLAVAERALDAPSQGRDPIGDRDLDDEIVDDLTFRGLVAIADPVRPTAAAAVAGVRRAGVEVVMITGDHPSTAEGIAVELGILNGHRVLTGAELATMDDRELDEALPEVSVLARVTPSDKVRVIEAYQRLGRSVAMAGDGANDAAAIRLADAGIALGERSTAAARAAADIVVTDDRIETVVDAIVEGRAMWSSVRDALAILVGGNLGEIAFTVAGSAISGDSPLNTRQILLVNLLTDVVPAMVVASRPPRGRTPEALLYEGPERSLGDALRRAVLIRAATTATSAGLAWGTASLMGRPRRARTVGLVALVGSQLAQTAAMGWNNPPVLLSVAGSFAVLAVVVQTPGLSNFFGCTPLGPAGWLTAAGSVATVTGSLMVGAPILRRLLPAQASAVGLG